MATQTWLLPLAIVFLALVWLWLRWFASAPAPTVCYCHSSTTGQRCYCTPDEDDESGDETTWSEVA